MNMIFCRQALFCSKSFNQCGLFANRLYATAPSSSSVTAISEAERQITEKQIELLNSSVQQLKMSANEISKDLEEMSSNWKIQNEIYFGKERDFENYPTMRMPELHPKVRLGFLPDSWFNALYDRTGVTGPYLLFFGSLLFFVQKELWVFNHEFVFTTAFVSALYFSHRKFGPKLKAFAEKGTKKLNYAVIEQPLEQAEKFADAILKSAKEGKESLVVSDYITQAKHENVDLQLENHYRDRLRHVNQTVLKRMQYHIDKEHATKKFKQDYIMDWVVKNVQQSITPQLQKQTFQNCIEELKQLAQTQKLTGPAKAL